VIRRDVLVNKHGLNGLQAKAVGSLLQHGKMTIQDFEKLSPETSRRSLQRDLKLLIDQKLISGEGSTHHLEYRRL